MRLATLAAAISSLLLISAQAAVADDPALAPSQPIVVKTEKTETAGLASMEVRAYAGGSAILGALVTVNRVYAGGAPYAAAGLKPGSYVVEVSAAGYYPLKSAFLLEEKTKYTIVFNLVRITGFLSIAVDPADASIYVDGEKSAPGLLELPIGQHQILARRFAYAERELAVVLQEGETAFASIRLEPAPFEVSELSMSRPLFNPANAGLLGQTTISFRVTSYARGILTIRRPDGGTVLERRYDSISTWDQSLRWNGRDRSGAVLPDGEYGIRLELKPDEGFLEGRSLPKAGEPASAAVREAELRIDSGLVIRPMGASAAMPGLLYFPDPRTARAGEVALDLAAFALPSAEFAFGLGASFSLTNNYLLSVAAAAEASTPSGFSLAASLTSSLWRADSPPSPIPGSDCALFARGAFSRGLGSIAVFPGAGSGLELSLPLAFERGGWSFGMAPGLAAELDSPVPLYLASARAGIWYSSPAFRGGLSGRFAYDMGGRAPAWPASIGAEFRLLIAPTPLLAAAWGLIDLTPNLAPQVRLGLALGFLFSAQRRVSPYFRGAPSAIIRSVSHTSLSELLDFGRPSDYERLEFPLPSRTREGILELPAGHLEELAARAFGDIAFFHPSEHLELLAALLRDADSSDAERYVAAALVRNAAVAAEGILPLCQDTGTAVAYGWKGNSVFTTRGSDETAIATGAARAACERGLRASQAAPLGFLAETITGDNLPALVDIRAAEGAAYRLCFAAKGGGSANRTSLCMESPALLDERALEAWLGSRIGGLGAAGCPPYRISFVLGGTGPDQCLYVLALAGLGLLDGLPAAAGLGPVGGPLRDRAWEARMRELAARTGVGAQFGGTRLALDVRAIRLSRHAASLPAALGVSCASHRKARAVIDEEGFRLERLEKDPGRFLPKELPLLPEAARIDLDRPLPELAAALGALRPGSFVLLSGTVILARDAAHARFRALAAGGLPLPEYLSRHPVLYAGPTEARPGLISGSFGPTTAGRMDAYLELLMSRGASLVTIAKGGRSPAAAAAIARHRGAYLACVGGAAALTARENVVSSEVIDFPELGMEAVRRVVLRELPAMLVIDAAGRDFYASLNEGAGT